MRQDVRKPTVMARMMLEVEDKMYPFPLPAGQDRATALELKELIQQEAGKAVLYCMKLRLPAPRLWSRCWASGARAGQPRSQEEHRRQPALRASRDMVLVGQRDHAASAFEEAQLRWALEESVRLAEQQAQQAQVQHKRELEQQQAQQKRPPGIEGLSAEDIRRHYEEDQQKARQARSSQRACEVEAAAVLADSDGEARAWDSEELPPLELLPDSEE